MRYYVVKENDTGDVISLIFHDYMTLEYFCKSKSKSFKLAFNNFCNKTRYDFIKTEDSVVYQRVDSGNYNWMDLVVEALCGGCWSVFESGEVNEFSISDLEDKFLTSV